MLSILWNIPDAVRILGRISFTTDEPFSRALQDSYRYSRAFGGCVMLMMHDGKMQRFSTQRVDTE